MDWFFYTVCLLKLVVFNNNDEINVLSVSSQLSYVTFYNALSSLHGKFRQHSLHTTCTLLFEMLGLKLKHVCCRDLYLYALFQIPVLGFQEEISTFSVRLKLNNVICMVSIFFFFICIR